MACPITVPVTLDDRTRLPWRFHGQRCTVRARR
jgi:hypothetical protein